MSLNIELAEQILTQITEHPETHDQSEWCGSAKCIAGWACELSGWIWTGEDATVRKGRKESDAESVAMNLLFDGDQTGARLFYVMGHAGGVGELRRMIDEAKRLRAARTETAVSS